MRTTPILTCLLCVVGSASLAHGHGTPIVVHVVENKFEVSGGVVDSEGFASRIFVESTSAGDPFGRFSLDPFGPVVFWELPGFELYGLEVSSGLYLEVLPRPVSGSDSVSDQLLWYAEATQGLFDDTPGNATLHVVNTAGGWASLLAGETAAPPPLFVATPASDDLGQHKHLLGYALDNSSTADAGAYGFFARLTSDLYEPSDPFLVVLNNSVPYQNMIPAALAINAAAVDPNAGQELSGDYNGNGVIDAADYGVWRDAVTANSIELLNDPTPGMVDEIDFTYWRDHFGATLGSGSGAAGSTGGSGAVPEPTSALPAAVAAMWFWLTARQRPPASAGGLTA